MQVSRNKVVSIDYTLKDDAGTVLDSSEGSEPLAYLHGVGGLIPGLESALEGRNTGDHLQVTVQPADGYGEGDDELVKRVPRNQFAGAGDLELGMQFRVSKKQGGRIVTVMAIEDETVTIDGNHALAGVTLNFDVTIRDIRDATAEELEHGHVHGPGGHHHH